MHGNSNRRRWGIAAVAIASAFALVLLIASPRAAAARSVASARVIVPNVQAHSSSGHTRTYRFRAFNSAGKPLLHVTGQRRGSCYSGSLADQHRNAWRCTSGNGLYDPCFSSSKHPNIVLCPDVPKIKTAVEIHLKRKLPTSMANEGKHINYGFPWLMRTSGGLTCEIGTGANSKVDGLVSYYYCPIGHDHFSALWGKLHRNTEPWTIRIGSDSRPSKHETKILTAWY